MVCLPPVSSSSSVQFWSDCRFCYYCSVVVAAAGVIPRSDRSIIVVSARRSSTIRQRRVSTEDWRRASRRRGVSEPSMCQTANNATMAVNFVQIPLVSLIFIWLAAAYPPAVRTSRGECTSGAENFQREDHATRIGYDQIYLLGTAATRTIFQIYRQTRPEMDAGSNPALSFTISNKNGIFRRPE